MRRALALIAFVALFSPVAPGEAAAGDPVELLVLSSRADQVTDGDALVEVVLPRGADRDDLVAEVGGRDVTQAFGEGPGGRTLGLVTGLALGRSTLEVTLPGTGTASLELTVFPKEGPVFSGPHLQPWLCETEGNGLGAPTDAACNAPTVYAFSYKPTGSETLADYDPESPPSDVDTTTTDEGKTVPYVVRTEKGTSDRGIYSFSVLYDPAKPWTALQPQEGWNRKLLWKFGSSSDGDRRQAAPLSTLDPKALSRGYGVATNSLNVNGNNSNQVLSAETLYLLRERIVEQYGGPIRYTMGDGCSGASIQQHRIASAYPGLLQGIQPNCSYPDTWTVRMEVGDCVLFNNYFATVSPQLWPVVPQRAAVTGYQTSSSCLAWEALFGANGDPQHDCAVPAEQVYDPATNPDGVRCTSSDFEVNLWGLRDRSVWTDVEKKIGRGFARNIFNNRGVQYGLVALQEGVITPEQFVDLNEKIGTKSIDWEFVEGRSDADPGAVDIAYSTGLVNDFRRMDEVAILDLRGTSNNEIHTDFHSYEMRERIALANGDADNHVIWTFPTSIVLPPAIAEEAFVAMDRWLAAVEADTAPGSLADKVARGKPTDVTDRCYLDVGNAPPVEDLSVCEAAFPHYGSPRIAAGGPTTHDNVRCEVTPLPATPPATGYGSLPFVAGQWERLRAAFPQGVCDWTKQPADRTPSRAMLTFAAGPRGVPMGAAPESVFTGLAAAPTPAPVGALPATGWAPPAAALLLLLPIALLLRRRSRSERA